VRATRYFLCVSLLVTLPGHAGPSEPTSPAVPERPSIVFIYADDLRFDMLRIAGNEQIHTPVLDGLARRGVYFTQATVHIPQCCPARAMLLSGLTPFQSGYTSIEIQAPGAGEPDSFERFPTLPGLLREAGYHTVLTGKWHIKPDPWRSGFAEVRHWLPEGMVGYQDPPLSWGESRDISTVPGNITEIFTDDAVDFLRSEGAQENPFFLWLAHLAPHEPCGPTPERINALYEGVTSEDLVREGIELGNSPRWDPMWRPYFQAVTHMDEQIGRVLDTLDSTGLAATTVVFFVSDSGIMMNRRGIGSKVVPYEDSIRIPLIVSAPWIEPRRSGAAVSDLDLPPTLLAIAGLEERIPSSWSGRNIARLITTGIDEGVDFAISLWDENVSRHWGHLENRTIRTPAQKLIVWSNTERDDEFYDLRSDPHEERNLVDSPEYAAARNAMRRQLMEWMGSAGDPAISWTKFND
jgi:arylsulfatase A-like enzyme